ncbi:MAG: hypothetical protein ABSG64_05300 [Solirubrobacteraceae bacterium]
MTATLLVGDHDRTEATINYLPYQAIEARIEELRRQAAQRRLVAAAIDGRAASRFERVLRRLVPSRPRQAGPGPRRATSSVPRVTHHQAANTTPIAEER